MYNSRPLKRHPALINIQAMTVHGGSWIFMLRIHLWQHFSRMPTQKLEPGVRWKCSWEAPLNRQSKRSRTLPYLFQAQTSKPLHLDSSSRLWRWKRGLRFSFVSDVLMKTKNPTWEVFHLSKNKSWDTSKEKCASCPLTHCQLCLWDLEESLPLFLLLLNF